MAYDEDGHITDWTAISPRAELSDNGPAGGPGTMNSLDVRCQRRSSGSGQSGRLFTRPDELRPHAS
jgi:hypothetical protein